MSKHEGFTKVWYQFRFHANKSRSLSTGKRNARQFPEGAELQEAGLAFASYHFGLDGRPELTTTTSAHALLGMEEVEIQTYLRKNKAIPEESELAKHRVQVIIYPETGYYTFEHGEGLKMKVVLRNGEVQDI